MTHILQVFKQQFSLPLRHPLTYLIYLQSFVNSHLSTQQLHAYSFINLIHTYQMSRSILHTYIISFSSQKEAQLSKFHN